MLEKIVDQRRGNQRKRRSKKILKNDDKNHKITEYFEVRRSSRKPSGVIQKEEYDALREAVQSLSNEKFLEIYEDEKKGRGIRSLKKFRKNEFVVEYKGEIISLSVAKIREKEYELDENIGSFMYFFAHKNKQYCVDATDETPFKGRLINHSILRPNLKTKVIEISGSIHLVLIAKRDIEEGEELLYDYGDRTSCNVANNPWLLTS